MNTDVVILGGGPGGAAAALTLAQAGAAVAVLERPPYHAARVGETLSPGVAPLLHRLGLWEAFVGDGHLPSPGIVSVWRDEAPHDNDFIFNPYGHGWHLDRTRFDAMLATAAEERGAVFYRNTHVLACSPEASGTWRVQVQCERKEMSLRARFLVDATGRASWLARRQGARRLACDRLVGVISLFRAGAGAEHDARLLLEASEQGWWYSALLPEDRLAVAYMTDVDLLPKPPRELDRTWAAHLSQTVLTRRRLAGAVPLSSTRIVAANSSCMDRVAGENWLAVGDAAMAWDPLSSQGIGKALESGLAAAHTVGEALAGRTDALADYDAAVAKAFKEYRRLHARYYGQVRRWPGSAFWQRRQVPPARFSASGTPARPRAAAATIPSSRFGEIHPVMKMEVVKKAGEE
jgi:flavin-dependent dehydrogenase